MHCYSILCTRHECVSPAPAAPILPRSVEAHIMHRYSRDFYGQPLRLVALGYIRCVVDCDCSPFRDSAASERWDAACRQWPHHVAVAECEDAFPLPHLTCPLCRPEVRFGGLQELLGRINTDIGIARSQLDLPQWQAYAQQLASAAPKRA